MVTSISMNRRVDIKENFLHYLWRLRYFSQDDLKTTQSTPILIKKIGQNNTSSGPDFFNARIIIGDTTWAGNVELHVYSSDWLKHEHQEDDAYDNVILHVVYEEDIPIYRKNGERIPCLELKSRIPPNIYKTYQKLIRNEYWVPCQNLFYKAPDVVKSMWLERLLIERIEEKTTYIARELKRTNFDWEQTFYQFLARAFGFKTNADAFEQLAWEIPVRTLLKHKKNLLQIEALLFGQAGLLARNFVEDYPRSLQVEYQFLATKYSLTPNMGIQWKFMRMRPANFPTIRMAQLAQLLYQSNHLFSKVLASQNVKELVNALNVEISGYWKSHYVFDKEVAPRRKKLGKTSVHSIIINTVVPFLFFYGQYKQIGAYTQKALTFLEQLPAEKNTVISHWETLGVKVKNAAQSQALLQLKNEYCMYKKCLDCAIGNAILNRS